MMLVLIALHTNNDGATLFRIGRKFLILKSKAILLLRIFLLLRMLMFRGWKMTSRG